MQVSWFVRLLAAKGSQVTSVLINSRGTVLLTQTYIAKSLRSTGMPTNQWLTTNLPRVTKNSICHYICTCTLCLLSGSYMYMLPCLLYGFDALLTTCKLLATVRSGKFDSHVQFYCPTAMKSECGRRTIFDCSLRQYRQQQYSVCSPSRLQNGC